MHAAVDADNYSYYTYDYTGERTLKLTGRNSEMDVNAELQHTSAALDRPTLYPSPYLVMGMHGYTKHYYAGTERLFLLRVCTILASVWRYLQLDHQSA